VKPSQAANDNLTSDLGAFTRQIWEPRLGRNLNREDVREIAKNLTGFFTILAEWSRVEVSIPANDNDAFGPAPRATGERSPMGDDNRRGERGHD
jgi:hypothetical protein